MQKKIGFNQKAGKIFEQQLWTFYIWITNTQVFWVEFKDLERDKLRKKVGCSKHLNSIPKQN